MLDALDQSRLSQMHALLHDLNSNQNLLKQQERVSQSLTVQLSSRMTVSPSSPNTTPPPACPGSPCLSLRRAASCVNMPLCTRRRESAFNPIDPFRVPHFHRPQSYKGAVRTHRDVSIAHSSLPLYIILAQNLIALVHPLPARETPWVFFTIGTRASATSSSTREGRKAGRAVHGRADVDSRLGISLRTTIWGEDLYRVVDARDSQKWLIWMSLHIQSVRENENRM